MAEDEVLEQLVGDLGEAVMRAKAAGAPPADVIGGLADIFAQLLVAAQLQPARTLRLFDGVVTSAYARHAARHPRLKIELEDAAGEIYRAGGAGRRR